MIRPINEFIDVEQIIALHWHNLGTTQWLPHGWREVGIEGWSQSTFFGYEPEATMHQQFYWSTDGTRLEKGISATLFFFHDQTGIAFEQDYWKKNVIIYAFGCHHQTVEITFKELREITGNPDHRPFDNFDHAFKCTKCGYTHVVNSSD